MTQTFSRFLDPASTGVCPGTGGAGAGGTILVDEAGPVHDAPMCELAFCALRRSCTPGAASQV